MECGNNAYKYIVMDIDITYSLDFNGWPDEVVILEVKGLKKALGVNCLLFDSRNNLSISDIYKVIDEQQLDYIEDGWHKKGGMTYGPQPAEQSTSTADRPGTATAADSTDRR